MSVQPASDYLRFPHSFEKEVEKFKILFQNQTTNNTFVSNPLKKQSFTLGEYKNWISQSPQFTWKDYNSSKEKK